MTRLSEKQKEVMPLPARHPDLERALERLVDGGTAGRWEVTIDCGSVTIRRRGDEDGYETAGRIAKRIDELHYEPCEAAFCEACGEGLP